MRIIFVIQAGGAGTRLAPLSSAALPKQFVPLGNKSLFQEALERAEFCQNYIESRKNNVQAEIVILGNQKSQQALHKNLNGRTYQVFLQPENKETAAALCTLAAHYKGRPDDTVLCCMPSDHKILDTTSFCKTILKAVSTVQKTKCFVALGIRATKHNPQLGYHVCAPNTGKSISYKVSTFLEKPEAAAFYEQQSLNKLIYADSGITLFNLKDFLGSFSSLHNENYKHCSQSIKKAAKVGKILTFSPQEYSKISPVSLAHDYMQKINNIRIVELLSDWSDIGTWESFISWHTQNKNQSNIRIDRHSNIFIYGSSQPNIYGLSKHLIISSKDYYFCSPIQKLVGNPKEATFQDKIKSSQKTLKETFKQDMFISPWKLAGVSTGIIFITPHNTIILGKKHSGQPAIIGGFVDWGAQDMSAPDGENLIESLLRETEEEVGFKLDPFKININKPDFIESSNDIQIKSHQIVNFSGVALTYAYHLSSQEWKQLQPYLSKTLKQDQELSNLLEVKSLAHLDSLLREYPHSLKLEKNYIKRLIKELLGQRLQFTNILQPSLPPNQ